MNNENKYDTMDSMIQWTIEYDIIQYYNTIQQTMNTISNNIQYNAIYNDYNMIQYTMDTIDNEIQ